MENDPSGAQTGLGAVSLAVLLEETPEQCLSRREASLVAARNAALAAGYSARLIAQTETSLRCAFNLADAFDNWFGKRDGP